MVIYYHTVDGGDGSSHVRFFDSAEAAKIDMEQTIAIDGYSVSDGTEFFEAENVTGLRISTLDDMLRGSNGGPYELASCPYCDEQVSWWSRNRIWRCEANCDKSAEDWRRHNYLTDEDVL